MAQKRYTAPTLPDDVIVEQLVPDDAPKDALTSETMVVCLNRGSQTLVGQHDGTHYTLEPRKHYSVRFGTARHLQGRFIVPGTRDPQKYDRAVSQIGILGFNSVEDCRPFTAAELRDFGQRVEGLARNEMESPRARAVHKISLRSKGPKAKGSRRPERSDLSEQATSEARERAKGALRPPKGLSSAERDQAEREAEERGR